MKHCKRINCKHKNFFGACEFTKLPCIEEQTKKVQCYKCEKGIKKMDGIRIGNHYICKKCAMLQGDKHAK